MLIPDLTSPGAAQAQDGKATLASPWLEHRSERPP